MRITGQSEIHSKLRRITGSLRTQLILYFTIFSLGVMAAGSYFTYIYIMNIIKKQNEKLLLQQFRQSDKNIKSMMNETDRLIRLLTLDDKVDLFLQTQNFDPTSENTDIDRDLLGKISDFISIDYSYIDSIYFFTDNFGEIGRDAKFNYRYHNDTIKPGFYNSKLYLNLVSSYPKTVWEGGYREDFFNPGMVNNPDMADSDVNLISAAKTVKSVNNSYKKAYVVFNIDERQIASIYAGSGTETGNDSAAENMYMIDGNGRIISSGNGKNIGEISPVITNIRKNADGSKEYGSFTATDGKSQIQTIYYNLEGTDWYFVDEIPLKPFSGDIEALQKLLLFIFLASFLLIFSVSFFWLRKITEPLHILAGKMHDMSGGKLGQTFSKVPENELGIVIKRFNEMSVSIVDLLKKNEMIQEEKRKLEIEALQSHINPHFIYNTLNMIKWMAVMTKSKNIIESIVSLGNLLNPVFKSMDKMCPLNEETEYIKNYLKIMNLRFGNGISLKFDIPGNLGGYMVPRFVLQPVIENSILHGIRKPENRIDISIKVYVTDDVLHIEVLDNGTGIPEDILDEINRRLHDSVKGEWGGSNGSIGLYNVNRRIVLNFGDGFGIRLESREGEGTGVLVRLPVICN